MEENIMMTNVETATEQATQAVAESTGFELTPGFAGVIGFGAGILFAKFVIPGIGKFISSKKKVKCECTCDGEPVEATVEENKESTKNSND